MNGAIIPVNSYEDISSSFTTDSNFTLLSALKINGIVYLAFSATAVTVNSGSAYTKSGLMSSNKPKNTVCVSMYGNNNNMPTTPMGIIDVNGQLTIRAGGNVISGGNYTIYAVYPSA